MGYKQYWQQAFVEYKVNVNPTTGNDEHATNNGPLHNFYVINIVTTDDGNDKYANNWSLE